jgi:hypothetical protein
VMRCCFLGGSWRGLKEIIVDVLLEEMLERLSVGWRKEEKRIILREHLKRRIEEIEEDLCKFVTEVEGVGNAYR